jgi:hypothetical protein
MTSKKKLTTSGSTKLRQFIEEFGASLNGFVEVPKTYEECRQFLRKHFAETITDRYEGGKKFVVYTWIFAPGFEFDDKYPPIPRYNAEIKRATNVSTDDPEWRDSIVVVVKSFFDRIVENQLKPVFAIHDLVLASQSAE